MLKPAGWIPKDHPLPASMLLADLEIVFDMLQLAAQKIHYLRRRSELEANMKYMADEMALLGFYLLTGFNIGEAEFNGQNFQLTGISKEIDEYYTSLDHGIPAKRPEPKLTKWWKDICGKLQERKFYQWSDAANILLSFSFSEQTKGEKYFAKIKRNVIKRWTEKDHKCSIIVIPNTHRSDALSLFAFRRATRRERHTRMENIAAQVFETPHVQRCLVLGVDIDEEHSLLNPHGVRAVRQRLWMSVSLRTTGSNRASAGIGVGPVSGSQVRFDAAGAGNGFTVELVRHRQTKETEQIGFTYGTPRQSSTLHSGEVSGRQST